MGEISQELKAAIKSAACLVSTSVHLGSVAFDSFVPACRFIDRAGLLMAVVVKQSSIMADGCDSNADCSC